LIWRLINNKNNKKKWKVWKLWHVKKVGRKRKNILQSREDIFIIKKSANNPDN